jgi:nicotinamidase/pyrazinamidase
MISLGSKDHVASLDVDAQYGFTSVCPHELPIPEGESIVTELNRQAEFARYRLGSKDAHSPHAIWVTTPEIPPLTPLKRAHVDLHWPLHCVPGTKGFELISGLPHPSEYDFFVWKGVEPDMHPYGACYHDLAEKMSTGLIEFLYAKQVRTVLVGGLATDYCVKTTVQQLLSAGFQTIVNIAACRGLTPTTTEAAIQAIQAQGAIIIRSSDDLCVTP